MAVLLATSSTTLSLKTRSVVSALLALTVLSALLFLNSALSVPTVMDNKVFLVLTVLLASPVSTVPQLVLPLSSLESVFLNPVNLDTTALVPSLEPILLMVAADLPALLSETSLVL